jgi:hypothetical protein
MHQGLMPFFSAAWAWLGVSLLPAQIRACRLNVNRCRNTRTRQVRTAARQACTGVPVCHVTFMGVSCSRYDTHMTASASENHAQVGSLRRRKKMVGAQ